VQNDGYLLKNELHEQAITHRIGLYLQRLFPDWDVDCEWNKNGDKPKSLSISAEELLQTMKHIAIDMIDSYQRGDGHRVLNLSKEPISIANLKFIVRKIRLGEIRTVEIEGKEYYELSIPHDVIRIPVRPDIIIHRRGRSDNLAVIEAKKVTKEVAKKQKYEIAKNLDLLKLGAFLSDPSYGYQNAYFLELTTGNDYYGTGEYIILSNEHDERIKILQRK